MASLAYDPARRIGAKDLSRERYVLYLMAQLDCALLVVTLVAQVTELIVGFEATIGVYVLIVGFALYAFGLELAKADRLARSVVAWCCLAVATGMFVGLLVWRLEMTLLHVMLPLVVWIIVIGLLVRFSNYFEVSTTDWRLKRKHVLAVFLFCVFTSGVIRQLSGGDMGRFATLLLALLASFWTGYIYRVGLDQDPTRLNVAKVTTALLADMYRQPRDARRWRH